MHALVIDDEPLCARRVEIGLRLNPSINKVSVALTPQHAREIALENHPDVVFLDIQMPEMNGFQLANLLTQPSCAPELVFVTAYDHYAVRAFDVEAADYILKPVTRLRLDEAVNRVTAKLKSRTHSERCDELERLVERLQNLDEDHPSLLRDFWIKDKGQRNRIPAENVQRIDAARDYAILHTAQKNHIIRRTISSLEEDLDKKLFIRVHRSHIINRQYATKLTSNGRGIYQVHTDACGGVPVGRSYLLVAKKAFS